MPFTLTRSDITTLHTDAIVNAANSALAPGGGVCGAIFAAAGYQKLERACREIGHCAVGQAVMTDGFSLPAKRIIHTVGPVWRGGGQGEAALLESCYRSSLHLAAQAHCRSVAFPLISAGIFGYPKQEAFAVAVQAVREFLEAQEMDIILVLFDRGVKLLDEGQAARLQSYIDSHLTAPHPHTLPSQPPQPSPAKQEDEPFPHLLRRLADARGMAGEEVCKQANLRCGLFPTLCREGYQPARQTALALAAALRLELAETRDFLQKAGSPLSSSRESDVIFEYFIAEGRYDIYEINAALFTYGQPLLGA